MSMSGGYIFVKFLTFFSFAHCIVFEIINIIDKDRAIQVDLSVIWKRHVPLWLNSDLKTAYCTTSFSQNKCSNYKKNDRLSIEKKKHLIFKVFIYRFCFGYVQFTGYELFREFSLRHFLVLTNEYYAYFCNLFLMSALI